ncbi:hypothetical protein [uncultured Mediterranean phage uvMED]|nr:hypothetical protein [uncultured Mediterranean phage uvMED]
MEKGIEIVRRLLLFCLWLSGGGFCVFCIFTTLFMLGGWLGIYDAGVGEDAWKAILLFPVLAVVSFVVTFLLHVAVNWIFQKD